MGKERQLRKQEEIRKTILDVARDIIAKDGVQGLSIRKITNVMNYSPAIIYHYFEGKDEIIETLVSEGYQRILDSIGLMNGEDETENITGLEPEAEIKKIFTNYIHAALAFPEEYKAFMLNDDARVLKKTALLERGISQKSQTMQRLCANLQNGVNQGRYASYDLELTAQIIWTSAFGLIIKLMVEKDISKEQVNRLIDHHFNVIFNGIMLRKE